MRHIPGMTSPPLTAEQCVAAGGHCWQPAQFEMAEAVWGGKRERTEHCKHCPATRHGVSREPWEWAYPDGQP